MKDINNIDGFNDPSIYKPYFEALKRVYETFMWRDYKEGEQTLGSEIKFVSEHLKNLWVLHSICEYTAVPTSSLDPIIQFLDNKDALDETNRLILKFYSDKIRECDDER